MKLIQRFKYCIMEEYVKISRQTYDRMMEEHAKIKIERDLLKNQVDDLAQKLYDLQDEVDNLRKQ